MRSSWLPAVLQTAPLLFASVPYGLASDPAVLPAARLAANSLELQSRNADGQPSTPGISQPGEFVWRGEWKRAPEVFKKVGGIYSQGVRRILEGEKYMPSGDELGSSLYVHSMGEDFLRDTRYVSTTSDPAQSFELGELDTNVHPFPSNKPFLYMIRSDAKMIDLGASTAPYTRSPQQAQQAVVGYVPWDQIIGWYDLSNSEYRDVLFLKGNIEKMKKGEILPGFVRNPDHNPSKYANPVTSGAQRQLAGFPRFVQAWDDPDWTTYNYQSVAQNLNRFIQEKLAHADQGQGLWEWARTPGIKTKAFKPRSLLAHMKNKLKDIRGAMTALKSADTVSPATLKEWRITENRLSFAVQDIPWLMKESQAMLKGSESPISPEDARAIKANIPELMERFAEVRLGLAEANYAVAFAFADKYMSGPPSEPPLEGEEKLRKHISLLERAVEQFQLLEEQIKKTADREKKIAEVVDKSDFPSIPEIVKKLGIVTFPDQEDMGQSVDRELRTVREELKFRRGIEQRLTKGLREAQSTLSAAKEKLGGGASNENHETQGDKDPEKVDEPKPPKIPEEPKPPTTNEPEKPAKEENLPRPDEPKQPSKEEIKETMTQKVQAVKRKALENTDSASKDETLTPLVKFGLKTAGLMLTSMGLAKIATGMAISSAGGGLVGGAAGLAGRLSPEGAALLDSFAAEGASEATVKEISALANFEGINAVSTREAIESVRAFDVDIAEKLIAHTAPKVSKKVVKKAMKKIILEASPARRNLPSRAADADDADVDDAMVRKWSALAMKDPMSQALRDVFKQVVSELATAAT
ncbi:Heat-labile enterotoxin IIA, A chain [Moelleriella libera RCEF 2490]|uniref:Heat-labile enterotoxin IIA, A chain n=1 Tax=Moelleriella libera RCEF 2490 TaxID=1081109 RepID=A0A166PT68_9HYPO|nr:Heat-labile enterotoxin IIA, A chain [Moelleriella libera RCEF 2490]